MEVRGGTKIIKAESTKPLVVAEIGVREGQHALGMLHELNIKKLYLVDHYQRYQETGYQEDAQEKQDNHYKVMFSNMDDYLDRVVFVTRSSELASELFEDEYFDFVYIDACHEYESVKKDIAYWYKKVKPGGYLGGHDYMYGWQGVVKAVDEFALANKLELKKDLDGFDWLIKK